MSLGNREGVGGEEPEPGDLPVTHQHIFRERNVAILFIIAVFSLGEDCFLVYKGGT